MKTYWLGWTLGMLMVATGWAGTAWGESWEFDFETGPVASGYNVVRIPGTTGTQISLDSGLTAKAGVFYRLRLWYALDESHQIGLLYAPLSLHAEGTAAAPIVFTDAIFPAGTAVDALYRFNSYRMTYRYRFLKTPRWLGHVGFTGKIRDAEIRLDGGGQSASKKNVGFVPLVFARMEWSFMNPWSLLLELDALAAPQGRAEDALLAVLYRADETWTMKLGYRMVEGGADNDEVFNFALIHYGVAGITASF